MSPDGLAGARVHHAASAGRMACQSYTGTVARNGRLACRDSVCHDTALYTAVRRADRVSLVTLRAYPSAPVPARPRPFVIMLSVTPSSSLAAPSISQRVHSLNRPNMVSVGTIVWLSSELMFFAGLFAMFFTVKAQHDGPWPPVLASTGEPIHLDVPYALVITIVLVASSFTCQWGVFKAEQGDVFGLRLLVLDHVRHGPVLRARGRQRVPHDDRYEGITIPSGAFGTVFYLTTGFHGLHVTGGLIAFIFLISGPS